jgi:Zn-finger nucleic acid-binding protein
MRLANGNASLRCDYCKAVFIAAKDDIGVQFLDQAGDLTCPVCEVPLWDSVLAGMQIHACKRCHGLLVAMGAFEALVDQMRGNQSDSAIPPPADPADLKRMVNCPRCRLRMDTHFYYGGGQAILSGCERCDLNWLDGGVLMLIVRAPHRSGENLAYWSGPGESIEDV